MGCWSRVKGLAVAERQAPVGHVLRPGGAPPSPGYRGTHPGRSSCVRNAVTPSRSGASLGVFGKPTVRRAELLGGHRMTREANAGSGNATGNRDRLAASSRRSSRITGRIRTLVVRRESVLTRSGEPVEKKMTEAPEPEDKLDAATAVVVNGPEDAPFDWHASDWRRVADDVRRLRQRIFTASKAGDLAK